MVDISDADFLDFESKLKNQRLSKESLKLNSAFVIDYFPSGKVDVKEDYFSDTLSYQIKQSCTIDDFKVSKKIRRCYRFKSKRCRKSVQIHQPQIERIFCTICQRSWEKEKFNRRINVLYHETKSENNYS